MAYGRAAKLAAAFTLAGVLVAACGSDDNEGGGHFSPLAAYNGNADDLLLMDVARYKYPPFWVDADLLWQAMATTDTSSGRHRGFILVDVDK